MKNNYVLILFAEKNIVSATSDMRKYIFPKTMLVLYLSRVYRIFFSRYPFSSHGALLVSTHTVSRALRFLMFNVFSVLLLSFYLVLCLSRVSRVFFSVPVLVPGRSVSVVPAIVNLCL